MTPTAIRSMLFVPANRPDRMLKARACRADAIILDLEDAVPAAEKAEARRNVVGYIEQWKGDPLPVFVRINDLSTSAALEDLKAVVRPGLHGVLVPKVTAPRDVHLVDSLLNWLEADAEMANLQVTITPVLETAAGMRDAREIAQSSARVSYLGGIGGRGGDVERALGYRWSPEGWESFVVRSQVLLDARAAGVFNPVTALWSSVSDLDGLRRFAEQNRSLGYEGMMVIHPSHVDIVNEVFSPTADELDYHRGLLETYDRAVADGAAAARYRGQMIDTAMAKTARTVLERHNES
jgi:citrate lyase subunit beta/citryl-CoA lyase